MKTEHDTQDDRGGVAFVDVLDGYKISHEVSHTDSQLLRVL
jgi:hypothetical protein